MYVFNIFLRLKDVNSGLINIYPPKFPSLSGLSCSAAGRLHSIFITRCPSQTRLALISLLLLQFLGLGRGEWDLAFYFPFLSELKGGRRRRRDL